jgi:hypothetical protein
MHHHHAFSGVVGQWHLSIYAHQPTRKSDVARGPDFEVVRRDGITFANLPFLKNHLPFWQNFW